MSIAFRAAGAAATYSAVTTVSVARPAGTAALDFLCITFAFESVAAGSGPYIVPNTGQFAANVIGPATGWLRAGWQAPAATGAALETWVAINGGAGSVVANFVASSTGVAVMCGWTGAYYTTGTISDGALRVAAFQPWTGNQPQSPAVSAFIGELVLAVGSSLMQTPGFGTPTGNGNEGSYTSRADVKRGAFGTGETTQADALAILDGTTGAITFPGNASASNTPGAMGTLVVRALGTTLAGSTQPFVLMEYPLA